MSNLCQITCIVENSVSQKALLAEHGLAVWLNYQGHGILFDTGQTLMLLHNANHLTIDFEQAQAIVLSHGHYDHTGGLEAVLTTSSQPIVYAHPNSFSNKYKKIDDGTVIDIGMPGLNEAAVRHLAKQLIFTTTPTELYPGLWVTGEIPRQADFEDVGGDFYQDTQCSRPDQLLDDQAIFFEAREGLVVLLGCAHAGVINTLHYIQTLTGNKTIDAIVGGLHLTSASTQRVDDTIKALQQLGVKRIFPGHCTGSYATAQLRQHFSGRCFDFKVATKLAFELS